MTSTFQRVSAVLNLSLLFSVLFTSTFVFADQADISISSDAAFVDVSEAMAPPLIHDYGVVPPCLANGQVLPVMDQQVISWKQSTPNQYLARAHVQGPITRVYPDATGHSHFEMSLGSGPAATLEIIYNQSFGPLPRLAPGMMVEACGDFINSFAPAGPYPASPDGAILHWVHRNPQSQGHESGYVAINGVVYGQGSGSGATY